MKRFLLAVVLAATMVLGGAGVALAQEIPNDAPAVAPVASLTLNAFLVLTLCSFLIPLAVGLLTKVQASTKVKQLITLIISAVTGVITTSTQIDGTAIISATTAQYALLSLGIAIVSYLGIYKPNDANAKLAPDFGVG